MKLKQNDSFKNCKRKKMKKISSRFIPLKMERKKINIKIRNNFNNSLIKITSNQSRPNNK